MNLRTTPPPVHQLGHLTLPQAETVTLPCGATLHTLHMGHEPVARLMMLWEGGQRDAASPAVASIATSLAIEGADGMDGSAIAEAFASRGATVRGTAAAHFCGYETASLTSGLDHTLGVLENLIVSPTYPAHQLDTSLHQATDMLRLNMEKVEWLADTMRDRLIAGAGHPQARRDTPESIMAITRSDLQAWHKAVMMPDRCHVYLCGHLTPAIVDSVARMTERIAAATAPEAQSVSPIVITPFSPAAPGRHTDNRPSSLQSAISIAIPAPPRISPQYIPLRLAVMALGGYFGSRLMSNLREDKGYTYGATAALYGMHEGSFTAIDVRCDNSYTDAVIDETATELRRLASCPPEGDELMRLHRHAASALASTLDSPFTIMDHYITGLMAGIPSGYFNAQQRVLARLTPQIIADAAAEFLDPDSMRIAVVGATGSMQPS